MKFMKYSFSLVVLILVFLSSCGDAGNTAENTIEESTNKEESNEWDEITIRDGGFKLTMKIPTEEIAGGKSEVIYHEDLGELEIHVGKNFDLFIFEDESQIEMIKNEISNHPFYKVEYVVENDSSLLYRYFTEDGSNEQWHTYVEKKIGPSSLLIRSNESLDFSEYASKKMLESALSIAPSK